MSHSLAEMEATVHPVQLALKEEEEEEAIESTADMQKVRICSEGGWVSEWSKTLSLLAGDPLPNPPPG